MSHILQKYASIVGEDVIEHLRQLSRPLTGMNIVHLNSTKIGGGVAEILHKMVPLMNELGLNTSWEIIEGEQDFYQCTKGFHNALQGNPVNISENLMRVYEKTNAQTAENLNSKLVDSDLVIIHDPQPAALIRNFTERKGKWVWRCHIDVSKPFRPIWKYLREFVRQYDASIFSLSSFAQMLPHPIYLIAPSIDPLHDKNIPLKKSEIEAMYTRFQIDPERPVK